MYARIRRYDSPEAWLRRFYPLLTILVLLPLVNFSNFLMLASRTVRILWYYCDDCVQKAPAATHISICTWHAWRVRAEAAHVHCSLPLSL